MSKSGGIAAHAYRVIAYKGYFVGSIAIEVIPGHFRGHAQICTLRPETYSSAKPLEVVVSVGTYAFADRAADAAAYQARQVVDGLLPNWHPFTAPGAGH